MLGALRRRVHELLRAIAEAHTQPARLGAAVLVGCLVGATPLFGLHLAVCIVLAWLFGLNQLVVYGAANISIPPLVPFLGFASVQLGERLLHGRWLQLTTADFRLGNAPHLARVFFLDWLVGGLAVGGALGLVGGAAVWRLAARRRAQRAQGPVDPAIGQAIARAAERYRGLPRKYRYYAYWKYRLDPCYRAIAAELAAATYTVDLGTGLGMLPVVLGELGEGRRALGVEWDAAKVACGEHAARGLDGISVQAGDLHAFALPPCDAITLVDVLHYYEPERQRALLQRCVAALAPGGRLLVREGDRAQSGGARWTRAVERWATRLGWNRGPGVRFRPLAELRADLEALGLAVTERTVAGPAHPGNVLLIGRKP